MVQQVARRVFGVCVLSAVCGVLAVPAQAAVPHLVRYQGSAADAKGVPLEGPYTLTLRLYNAETLGTVVWQETQTGVPFTKGNFSVLLGQVAPLNVDWSQPLWLSLQVNVDPELSPRQRITSVPLAVRAEVAEGLATPPALKSQVVAFSRSAVAGAGTQAVTGMGFQPKAVWLNCRDSAAGMRSSVGFADELGDAAVIIHTATSISSTAAYIVDLENGLDQMWGPGSMNPDGFTILWSKSGAGLNVTCEAIGIR